jgi:hypothetical protein
VFTIVSGTVPPGLSMPSTFGCCGDAIGGAPTQAGVFTFTVKVRDSAGHTATQAFSIAISVPAPPRNLLQCGDGRPGLLSELLHLGRRGSLQRLDRLGSAPAWPGAIDSAPVSITGTPTTGGTFTFTVKVTDSRGAQATEHGSITIR